ncbi:low affinity immunoglobulin gamma Fc region receptor III-A-like, partial [Eleutherodactylus coqui]|uniref:low affinity immunoglobulin gamma Fc region receptor III-A-like n=1 Tax=Eleutherodactylus coqui TaxID=57060 RepID=UPI0034633C42
SGSYRCQTRPGEISDPARLDVSNGWFILQTPLYVYEGDEIHIRCHHRPGYFGGPTIYYKDDRVIRDWTDNAEYYIGHVDGTTAGTYRCGKKIAGQNIHYDEASVSVEGRMDNIGYTRQNIARLILSACVLSIIALFIFYHIKWMKSVKPEDGSTT